MNTAVQRNRSARDFGSIPRRLNEMGRLAGSAEEVREHYTRASNSRRYSIKSCRGEFNKVSRTSTFPTLLDQAWHQLNPSDVRKTRSLRRGCFAQGRGDFPRSAVTAVHISARFAGGYPQGSTPTYDRVLDATQSKGSGTWRMKPRTVTACAQLCSPGRAAMRRLFKNSSPRSYIEPLLKRRGLDRSGAEIRGSTAT